MSATERIRRRIDPSIDRSNNIARARDATDARVPLPRAAVRIGSDRIVHRN